MAKMILANGYYAAEKGSWNWITDGSSKFQDNLNITFWFADLPNLTNGQDMFRNCSNLSLFEGDLPNLTDGYSMFSGCSNLTSFRGDLSSMTNGEKMFDSCGNLSLFEGDLSALTNGNSMFFGCTSLTSFRGDLSALTNGLQMFSTGILKSAKLDLASVQHIAETINDLTDKTSDGSHGWGEIYIGIHMSLQGTAELETALAAIRAKGWRVDEAYSGATSGGGGLSPL